MIKMPHILGEEIRSFHLKLLLASLVRFSYQLMLVVVSMLRVSLGCVFDVNDSVVTVTGAVVIDDVPPNTLAGGVPARVIKKLESYS